MYKGLKLPLLELVWAFLVCLEERGLAPFLKLPEGPAFPVLIAARELNEPAQQDLLQSNLL